MKIFDPLGFLSPFLLSAKQHLRETWTYKLTWDESLPATLHKKWVDFFSHLADVSTLEYDRCLKLEDAVGKPTLVIFL